MECANRTLDFKTNLQRSLKNDHNPKRCKTGYVIKYCQAHKDPLIMRRVKSSCLNRPIPLCCNNKVVFITV